MTSFFRNVLAAAAAVSVIAWAPTASAADLSEIQDKGTIRIAVANEIPYGYVDPMGNAKGVGPDTITHIVEQLGIDNIEWSTTEFGALIPGIQAGRYDVVAAEMAILPDRCKQVAFSEPDSSYGEGLLVKKGNPKDIHSYESFVDSGHKVALVTGADQLEMLQDLGVPQDQIVVISSNADAISTVATGRADAYAATGQTAAHVAAKSDKVELAEPFEDPKIDGETVRSWGGFVVSKDAPELLAAINEELAKFKKTDAWQDIMSEYEFTQEDADRSFDRSTEELCTAD